MNYRFKSKINETKSMFFKKIDKIDKSLSRLMKEKGERTEINKIKNRREVTMISQKYKQS